jgi:hypothetical protein
MSQEPTFTAEQLLAEANMHGDHVADMLVYAATLRQAARVDEGMACRLYNSGYAAGHHHTVEGGFVDVLPVDFDSYHADEVREILSEVALSAQPAERQGDAVAKVRHFEYRGIARNGFSQEAEMLYGAPIVPDGTLLYLHPAAPMGVPERWLETIADAAGSLDKRGDRQMAWRLMWLHGQMLAAAPSAPQADRRTNYVSGSVDGSGKFQPTQQDPSAPQGVDHE